MSGENIYNLGQNPTRQQIFYINSVFTVCLAPFWLPSPRYTMLVVVCRRDAWQSFAGKMGIPTLSMGGRGEEIEREMKNSASVSSVLSEIVWMLPRFNAIDKNVVITTGLFRIMRQWSKWWCSIVEVLYSCANADSILSKEAISHSYTRNTNSAGNKQLQQDQQTAAVAARKTFLVVMFTASRLPSCNVYRFKAS